MSAEDIVHRQILAARSRIDALERRTASAPPEAHPFVDDALHELQMAMEELQVSEEELRQQNETLAESREELEEERHRYRELFHSAPDAYLVTDLDGTLREANRAAAALLGVRESSLVGKPLVVFVHPPDRRAFRARLARLPAEERVEEWDLRLRPRNGGVTDASCTVGVVRGRSGDAEGLRWLVRDVTDRRRAEDAARRLEAERAARAEAEAARARTEAILESIADGFLALDAEWRFTYVNRAAEFLLQRDRDELLGRTFGEAFPDDPPAVRAELERARREHDVAEFEEFHPSVGAWLEYRAYPAEDGLTLYVRDVTDRKVAQEELRASEERLRVALLAAGMGHWDWDLRSGAVHWSPEHNRLMGLPPEQARGLFRDFLERVHPDDRAAVAGALTGAAETGQDYSAEFRVVHPGGEVRWIAAYGRVLHGDHGPAARMIGVVRDVSARRRSDEERDSLAEQAATERAFLEAVMRQMPSGLSIAEAPSGRLILHNEEAERLLRHPLVHSDDLSAHRQYGAVHADGTPYRLEEYPIVRSVLTGEVVQQEEMRYRRGDGTPTTLAVSSAPVRTPEGRIIAAVSTFQDIDERKRREGTDRFLGRASDVLASSLDYRSTAQSVASLCAGALADACVVQVEDEGRLLALGIAHVDPARTEVLRGMLRRFPMDREGPHPLMRALRTGEAQLLPEVSPSLLEEIAADAEHLVMLRDLDLASAMVVPLQARGRTLGAIGLARAGGAPPYGAEELEAARELARRAALAVDNARLYEEARQAARARDEVLAVVSHDLRNPLHAVLLAATVLEDLSDPSQWSERDRRQIGVIRRSAEQMAALIQDLVEVIALESHAPALDRERLDAAAFPASVAELFQAQADQKGIRLVAEVEPGVPAVEADRGRLMQVFSNLLGNALKFTPRGGTVTVRARSGEGVVLFSVSDTGPGIPAEHLPYLFDRFWQAKRGERGGLGLGLAIARGIVEAHGGRIWAESALGEGTIFHFALPALPF